MEQTGGGGCGEVAPVETLEVVSVERRYVSGVMFSVGQLVNHCVDLNKVSDEFRPDDSDRVWEIVCEMVADLAAVERSSLKQDTDFVTDLGF